MSISNLSDEELLGLYKQPNDISSISDEELMKMYKPKTTYTKPNQPVKNMTEEEFKQNVDKLYNIPQVDIPQRGVLVNSNGEVKKGQNINKNLTPEKQAEIARIKAEFEARNREIDRQSRNANLRIGLGATMQGLSALPINKIPIVGSALGGALFDAGGAIMEGASGSEIADRAKRGALAGATVEGAIRAIPIVGKPLAQSKVGRTVIDKSNEALKPLLESNVAKNIGNVLTKEITVGKPKPQVAKPQPQVTKEVKAEVVEQPIKQVEEVVESAPQQLKLDEQENLLKSISLEEWLSKPRVFEDKPRKMSLDEWRSANGYKVPLEDTLDKVRAPKGNTKTNKKYTNKILNENRINYNESLEKYNELDKEGKIPLVRNSVTYNADGSDSDVIIAKAKMAWKRANKNNSNINTNENTSIIPEKIVEQVTKSDNLIPEQVVEATQPTQKQSKFIQTVKNSDLATDELKGKVNANYQTITNQETLQNAQNIIDNDFEGSIRKVLTNDKPEALDVAMAEDLARRLQQTGNPKDLETAVDIIERTATSLSKAGQTIQAASMWGRLTPEGSLLAYQREINRNIPKEVKEIIDNANSIIKKANTATTSKEAENIIRTGLKGLALTPKEKIVKQLKAGYDKNGKIDVDELVNAVKEKYNIKTITPDDIQEFNQLSKNVENATDKRQRDIAVALLKRKIEEVTPSSMGRKISTLQTTGQLLNPKTFIRNLGGNTLYGGVEDLTQTLIATPLDKLTSLRTGQRTIVPTNLATQFGGAKQGLIEGVEDVLKGVDTSPSNTKYDLFNGRTFRNKNTDRTNLSDIWEADSSNKAEVTKQYFNELLTKSRLGQAITERDLAPLKKMPGELANSIETLLNLSLRVPDRAAYQAVYNEAVENMLRAEKITNRGVVKELKQKLAKTKSENRKASIIKKIENLENPTPTDDILAQAQLEALQRTFQDTNQISSAAQGFKRWLNANKDFGLGDLTIKYPKTPANILSRGIDYSPIGLGRGLWNSRGLIAGNAPYNQRVANMEIARGLMGTGLYGAGLYSAANLGVRGKREDKQKLQQNLMAQGNRPYSIPVGNKSYSYDWAVPISMSYGGGANLNYGDDVIESILSASDPLTEQPLLQGARRILGGNYQDIPQALVGEVIGLPSSFYPAVARQTAQSIDPYYRETKSDKKGLLGTAETALNRLKANVPGYSMTLPIKYDVTGQPIRRAETAAGRIGQAFFNPANVSIRPDNETLDKSVNLYDYTGDSGALYPVANNKITISGEEKRLTSQERSDYQHDLGRITQSIRTNLFNDEEFNQLTEDEQVKQLEKYHNAINNAVKYRLFGVEPKSYKKLTNEILEYYDEY